MPDTHVKHLNPECRRRGQYHSESFVADLGFPRQGAPIPKWMGGYKPIICLKLFCKKYMKTKQIGQNVPILQSNEQFVSKSQARFFIK